MKNLPLSIILVNYRSADLLARFFASLDHFKLPRESYEVIISNNDTDEVLKLEALRRRHTFRLIHNTENIGFGAANNRAAALAHGEHLLFCNPDTECITALLPEEAFHQGITGFRLIDQSGNTEAWSVGPDVSLWEIIRNNLGLPPGEKLWQSTESIEVGRISGSAFAIPRTLFQELNGFDESFFLYFEDADLCRRARQAGYPVIYHPHTVLRHQSGHSMPSPTEQKRHYYTSQHRYFQKHRSTLEQSLLTLLLHFHL